MSDDVNEEATIKWSVKPCLSCERDTEGEDDGSADWYCSNCWPYVERDRMRAALAAERALREAATKAGDWMANAAEWVAFHPGDVNGWRDLDHAVTAWKKAKEAAR